MKVVFRAGMDTVSGYGNDACDMAVAMAAAGIDVHLWPTGVLPPLPSKVARLLTKPPTREADVVLAFAPPYDLRPWEFGSVAEKAVGWTMWERTPMREHDMEGHGWDEESRAGTGRWWSGQPDGGSTEDAGFQRVADTWALDLLLVTCPMNVEAFGALDPHVPLEVLPCGIDPERFPERRRDPRTPMKFGWVGTGATRKDPFTLLEAWRELKQDGLLQGAVLEMKCTGPGLHPAIAQAYPDVRLIHATWTREEYLAWLQTVDVMVSTSRGEGNNKPAMECMSTGGTVIATNWSGHQNWLVPGVTWPLKGALMEKREVPGVYDFRPDRAHLRELLVEAHGDPGRTAERGRRAATFIRDSLAWDKVIGDLEKILWRLLSN